MRMTDSNVGWMVEGRRWPGRRAYREGVAAVTIKHFYDREI